MAEASAPGKLILCGEHAVVYGRPAIALPVDDVRAVVSVLSAEPGSGVLIDAPDLDQRWLLGEAPEHPLSALIAELFERFEQASARDLRISIRSRIPIASGLGSGAAVATALVRALSRHLGHDLSPSQVADLVYSSERRLHGTPSGIDNTVVAYEQPIWFVRHNPPLSPAAMTSTTHPIPATIEPLAIGAGFDLLIGDTGKRCETRLPVGDLRERWQADPHSYEVLFDNIAILVARVRAALAFGDLPTLGALLNENHALLQALGVSSPELDRLVQDAQQAGALGAKLSGAGWGGVMLALVAPPDRERIRSALLASGAVDVLEAHIEPRTHDFDSLI